MVLMVIPAQQGKPTQYANNALLLRVASVMQQAGRDVDCVYADGGGTYAANAQHACGHAQYPKLKASHLAVRE
jgi:hypothetical protein